MTALLTIKEAASAVRMTPSAFRRAIVAPRLVKIMRRNARVILVHKESLEQFINRRSK